MARLQAILREPLSALTHLAACILALVGTIVVVLLSLDQPGKMLSLLTYGVSLTLLFAASTLLHGLRVGSRAQQWLNRLDHAAIFLLIAGTYTPIAYNFLPGRLRWLMLAVVWGVAFAGVLLKLLSARIDGFAQVAIYVILSWGGALPLIVMLRESSLISFGSLWLLVSGGVIYTVGFAIFYWRRPDPWPGLFGHHEIWHLCVIGASLCHYLFMLFYVVPVQFDA